MPWSDKPDGQTILGLCCGMFLNGTSSHGQDLINEPQHVKSAPNKVSDQPAQSEQSLDCLHEETLHP